MLGNVEREILIFNFYEDALIAALPQGFGRRTAAWQADKPAPVWGYPIEENVGLMQEMDIAVTEHADEFHGFIGDVVIRRARTRATSYEAQ